MQILLPSPRNSVAGQLSLLDGTKCTTILHDWSNNVNSLANERDLHILKVPSLEEILSSDDLSVYPYDKTFDEGKTDPYVILHTSGMLSKREKKLLADTHARIYRSS